MADERHGPGYIYLLRRADGWYRIGRTANPRQRFRSWRWISDNHHWNLEPVLMATAHDQAAAERLLHCIFADRRTTDRHNGYGPCHEWFKLTPRDLETFYYWTSIICEHIYHLNGSWSLVEKALTHGEL